MCNVFFCRLTLSSWELLSSWKPLPDWAFPVRETLVEDFGIVDMVVEIGQKNCG